jgi:Mg2+/Co2+ transporter CorC
LKSEAAQIKSLKEQIEQTKKRLIVVMKFRDTAKRDVLVSRRQVVTLQDRVQQLKTQLQVT